MRLRANGRTLLLANSFQLLASLLISRLSHVQFPLAKLYDTKVLVYGVENYFFSCVEILMYSIIAMDTCSPSFEFCNISANISTA